MDLYYVLGTLYMKLNILHLLEVFIDKCIQCENIAISVLIISKC